jgi:hypothetical protein
VLRLTLVMLLLCPAILAAEPMNIRGVTFAHLHRGEVGYGSDASRRQLDEIQALGGNWITVTDFVYMPDVKRPTLRWGGDRSLSNQRLARTIRDAKARGIQVLMKPHLWSNQFWTGDEWHGTVAMQNEADWRAFFDRYGDFLVEQATLGQEAGADAFCVGVEMKATVHRSDDWRRVIARVREVFDGPITYSANSDNYQNVDWWDATDCVGITAYFPLVRDGEPTEQAVRAGWRRVFAEMKPFADRVGRPICFTELGFSRSSNAAAAPWEHHEVDPDPALQAMLYRVALEEIAATGFVEGVFLWKWFTGDAAVAARMERGDVFGLQNRPQALAAIRRAWEVDR